MAGLRLWFLGTTRGNVILTVATIVIMLLIVPIIVYVERGQRRISITYAKRGLAAS